MCYIIKSAIENSYNGYLVETGNKDDLVNKMRIILQNKDICEKFSENSIQSSKRFNPDKVNVEWENYIKKIKEI